MTGAERLMPGSRMVPSCFGSTKPHRETILFPAAEEFLL
jgi:hypothetical protein